MCNQISKCSYGYGHFRYSVLHSFKPDISMIFLSLEHIASEGYRPSTVWPIWLENSCQTIINNEI